MLGRGPAGVVAPALRFGLWPAAAGCCLPSLSKEGSGALLIFGIPPRGMRGSLENPLPRRGGAKRRTGLVSAPENP